MNQYSKRRLMTATLLIFGATAIALLSILNAGASSEYNQIIGILGIIIIVWSVVSGRLLYGKFLVLILMFEMSYYILTSGQSFLYALNIPTKNYTQDLYVLNDTVDVNRAYIFNYLCLMLLHIGTMIRFKHKIRFSFSRHDETRTSDDYVPDYTGMMRAVGWVIFFVSIVPYVFQEYDLYRTYLAVGYREAYSSTQGSTSWAKLFDFAGAYFIYSVFLLLVAYKDNKTMRKVMEIIIYAIAFLNFAVGNRSEPICYIFALFWFKSNYSNTRSEKRLSYILLIGFTVVLFLIIPIIGATRNSGALSFDAIAKVLSGDYSVFNMIRETFIGMGWSGFPLLKTMQLVPQSYGYHYGQSYFFAALSVIPNLAGGTHFAVQYAGLPAWLMNALHMSYGPGFSIPAEAFYNFGWFGMLVMIPLGILIRTLLSEEYNKKNLLTAFSRIALFIVLFSFPRREMLTAIRTSVYNVGFLCFAVWYLQRSRAKSVRHTVLN